MSRLTIAALAVAAVAAGGVATASGAGSPSHAPRSRTFTAHPTGGGQIDNAPHGVSVGDEFYESGVLRAAGHRLGRYALTAQLVGGTPAHGLEQTTLTAFLPHGQVVATGGHRTVDRFTLPVVGGTGTYAGAAGTLSIRPGRHGSEVARLALGSRR